MSPHSSPWLSWHLIRTFFSYPYCLFVSNNNNNAVTNNSTPKCTRHLALVMANIFFGIGAVVGALGLSSTHPLVFALAREVGAGSILLLLSFWFYSTPPKSNNNSDNNHQLLLSLSSPMTTTSVTTKTKSSTKTRSHTSSLITFKQKKEHEDNEDHHVNNEMAGELEGSLSSPSSSSHRMISWYHDYLHCNCHCHYTYWNTLLFQFRQHWKWFALLGLVVFGNQAGFIVGIKLAGPLTGSVWQPSQPIFTAAISLLLKWEPFQRRRVAGIMIAFCGCIAMVLLKTNHHDKHTTTTTTLDSLEQQPQQSRSNNEISNSVYDTDSNNNDDNDDHVYRHVMGNIMFFVNCLCTSLYVIFSKKLISMYPPLVVTAWSYNVAAIYMFLATMLTILSKSSTEFFCPECIHHYPSFLATTGTSSTTTTINHQYHDNQPTLWQLPKSCHFALFYYIIFASVGSYGLITWANQYTTGTLVMSYTVLQPVTSSLLTCTLLAFGMVSSCTEKNDDTTTSTTVPLAQGGNQNYLFDHHSLPSTSTTTTKACLDPPSLGTFCGMLGVFVGLALVVSTEPSSKSITSIEKTQLVKDKKDNDVNTSTLETVPVKRSRSF